MDKKISQLNNLVTADQADLYAIVDVSANETKNINQQDLETTIANSSHFVDELVQNNYFTTELANNSNFITELTNNATFISNVSNFIINSGGSGVGGTLQQTFDFSDFSDDGSGNGIASFLGTLPTRAIPIGVTFDFTTAFDAASTMSVIEGQITNTVIGSAVPADTTDVLVGAAQGDPATFDFGTYPNPVVFMNGVVPSSGTVTVTIVYGLGFGGTIDIETANQDLVPGKTVGIAPFVGGIAYAGRKSATITLPDTSDTAYPTRQAWLDDDRVFVIYKVSGAATLKGIVGTVNRSTMTISFGSATTYSTTLQPQTFSLARLDTDKVAIMFAQSGAPKDIVADITTVSGSVITPSGLQAIITTGGGNNVGASFADNADTDTAVLWWEESTTGSPQVLAFDVSGTTVNTVGTPQSSLSTGGGTNSCYVTKIGTLRFAVVKDSAVQAGTITAGTMAIAQGSSVSFVNGPSGGSNKTNLTSIQSPDTGVIVISYAQGGSGAGNVVVGTVSVNTITLGTDAATSGILSLASSSLGGIGVIDTTTLFLTSAIGWQVFTISGTTISNAYIVNASTSGEAQAYEQAHLDLGGSYWILFNKTDTVNTSNENKLFILGMALGFTGIAQTTSPLGTDAVMLIKGKDSNQSGVVTGQKYTADGSGGIGMSSSGILTGTDASSVII